MRYYLSKLCSLVPELLALVLIPPVLKNLLHPQQVAIVGQQSLVLQLVTIFTGSGAALDQVRAGVGVDAVRAEVVEAGGED